MTMLSRFFLGNLNWIVLNRICILISREAFGSKKTFTFGEERDIEK